MYVLTAYKLFFFNLVVINGFVNNKNNLKNQTHI